MSIDIESKTIIKVYDKRSLKTISYNTKRLDFIVIYIYIWCFYDKIYLLTNILMNTIKTLSSQGKDLLKSLWYGTVIALLFASCRENDKKEEDKKENNKFDNSLPIAKGNLIGHGGKWSRDLPIYNQEWKLIDFKAGDTMQAMYDNWKLELLDLHGWEENWYQIDHQNLQTKFDYAQPIEDVVITEKIVQYEPVNTTPAK